jgi:hypothetical protein
MKEARFDGTALLMTVEAKARRINETEVFIIAMS